MALGKSQREQEELLAQQYNNRAKQAQDQSAWAGRKLRNTARALFPFDGKPMEEEPGKGPTATVPETRQAPQAGIPQTPTPKNAVWSQPRPGETLTSRGSSIVSPPDLLREPTYDNPARAALLRNRLPVAPGGGDPVTQLRGGVNLTHDRDGNRIYTQGTPGQDNYATAKVHSGTARPVDMARQAIAGKPRFTFEGSAEDAARFNAPVSASAQQNLTGRMIQARSPDYSFLYGNKQDDGKPKYLGKESGLGWKTRLGLYKEQMDTYNRERGLSAGMDLEAMREAGAGQRALLQAKGVNDANEIARRRLTGELGLNEARIASEGLGQQQTQLELDRARQAKDLQARLVASKDPEERRRLRSDLLASQGKADNPRVQVVTQDETDPTIPGATIKRSYLVDPETREVMPVQGGGDPMTILRSDPEALAAFNKLSPEQQQEKLALMRKRLAGQY